MATQVGLAAAESLGRRTREKPVQSYRDLMNPLRSKDYITGKKGLPRSERTLNTSSTAGSAPASPTDGSSSEGGEWPPQSAAVVFEKPDIHHSGLTEDSSPEISTSEPSAESKQSTAVSHAIDEVQPPTTVHATVEQTRSALTLIIAGLQPAHWTRFTPQAHLFVFAHSSSRKRSIASSVENDTQHLAVDSLVPAPRTSKKRKISSASAAGEENEQPLTKTARSDQHRPGLVRLSLKRKLPANLSDAAANSTPMLPLASIEQDVPIKTKQQAAAPKRLGRRTARSSATGVNDKSTNTGAAPRSSKVAATPSDSDTDSSHDEDLADWELPAAYGDAERPLQADCEDMADFVLRTQYRSLPDVTEFVSLMSKRIEKRSTSDLYQMMKGASELLKVWQDEYVRLDRITAPHSITQRRPVLGGRVPIDAQIYEDIKESILYDYVHDARKPPGYQDPVGQKAKSANLSRELRQRRKRKLDLDQSDETPIEPYRTRRQVAASSQPALKELQKADPLVTGTTPPESQDPQPVRKRGRPARDRVEVNTETTILSDASLRARVAGNSRARAGGRIDDQIQSSANVPALPPTTYPATREIQTQEHAHSKNTKINIVEDSTEELGFATSQAFDQARGNSVLHSSANGSAAAGLTRKKPRAKTKAPRANTKSMASTSTISIVLEAAVRDVAKSDTALPATKIRTPAVKKNKAPPTQDTDFLTSSAAATLDQTILQPSTLHESEHIPLAHVLTQPEVSTATEKTSETTVNTKSKRPRVSLKASKRVQQQAATSAGPSSAGAAPKGKRRRAVSTNASNATRANLPMLPYSTQNDVPPAAHDGSSPMIPTNPQNPSPIQLSWSPAGVYRAAASNTRPSLGNQENYAGMPISFQPPMVPDSIRAPTNAAANKNNGLKIRVSSKKKSKDSASSTSRLSNQPSDPQLDTELASSSVTNHHVSQGPRQSGHMESKQRVPKAQNAAQQASARLTQSLVNNAEQRSLLTGNVDSSKSVANFAIQSSEDQRSSSGDAAVGSSTAADAPKVDKRRLKKPPSQLRSETMTKWWADRKAKKLAEKENLKNLQARSQERMLLAGDTGRQPVNPFMLGDRPLLAYTSLTNTEGQLTPQVVASPTALLPPYNTLQSPVNSVFPRQMQDPSMAIPNHYPYSAAPHGGESRPPAELPSMNDSGRKDHRTYTYLQSPVYAESPSRERREPMQTPSQYTPMPRPPSPVEQFRPPTLPSLSQITDPSYQANGSGICAVLPRTFSLDSRAHHTYPPPPTQLRPIDPLSDSNIRSPHSYHPHHEASTTYDPPAYHDAAGARQNAQQQYSTWPPAPTGASQQPSHYYPPRAPILPSPHSRSYDQRASNMSPSTPHEPPRRDEYASYSHYPATQAAASAPQTQSYWPPSSSSSYARRQSPPTYSGAYSSQPPQSQYPPSYPADRPVLAAPMQSPMDEGPRYRTSFSNRDQYRMYALESDRELPGNIGPPIDPELLR